MNRCQRASFSRFGFTLLELMIALSILSTLMLVAWSMLANFRDVQEKGRAQATRLQTVRSIRLWMEEDAFHLALPSPSEPSQRTMRGPVMAGNSSPNRGRSLRSTADPTTNSTAIPIDLTGTTNSIQWTIHAPTSPVMVLSHLFDSVDETPVLNNSTNTSRSLSNSSTNDRRGPRSMSPMPSWPSTMQPILRPVQERIEYRLTATGRGDDQRWTLTRRRFPSSSVNSPNGSASRISVTGLTPGGTRSESSPFPMPSLSDRVLGAQDLFRVSNDDRWADDYSSENEIHWTDLSNARFRYSDGDKWTSSWNSRSRGRAPAAIEFCFDLPPVRTRATQAPTQDDLESTLSDTSSSSETTEEPLAQRDDEEIPECDIRMVIRLPEVVR